MKNSLNFSLRKREEIIFAYLYGSFLYARWFRDVDVAVFLDEKRVERKDVLDYEISLSLELEGEFHLPADVKVLNYAPLRFKYEVTKGEVIFTRDESLRFLFLEETWHRYLDYMPVEREFIEMLLWKQSL
ncbi:MAG: nucleotidyltransferase domain-containing protein [Euryarchaeota archaeon]|nr:nucleotidyltransferase domain-containing protein [Euryarchaeota archaeon]